MHNVCFKKTWTNYSTVSLLWFVQVFLKQTLYGKNNDEERNLEKFLEQDSKKQGSLLPYLLNLY